jgi:hypothetical protein
MQGCDEKLIDDSNAEAALAQAVEGETPLASVGAASECFLPPTQDPPVRSGPGGWSLVLLCVGLALTACCIIIPEVDSNRRLSYDAKKLELDLQQIKQQISVNDEFLDRIVNDPVLAQRLAERQMRYRRRGTHEVVLEGEESVRTSSPFFLVAVPPPPTLEDYRPAGGKLANWCLNGRSRNYLMAGSLMLAGMGMVLGYATKVKPPTPVEPAE